MISFHFGKAAESSIRSPFSMEWLQLGHRGSEYRVKRKYDCSLDEVLQFTNITGPPVSHERVHGLAGNPVDGLVHSPRIQRKKVPYQFRNVFGPFPKWWNVNREYPQPVIKVFTKGRLLHHTG